MQQRIKHKFIELYTSTLSRFGENITALTIILLFYAAVFVVVILGYGLILLLNSMGTISYLILGIFGNTCIAFFTIKGIIKRNKNGR